MKTKEEVEKQLRECEMERLRQIERERQRLLDVEHKKQEKERLKQVLYKTVALPGYNM